MSDIGLLMTSILVMGQKVSSNLPQQVLVQHENDLFKANLTDLSNSTTMLEVTPPEFTQSGDTSSYPVFSPIFKVKKVLSNILTKVVYETPLTDLEPNELSVSLLTQREIIADASDNSVIASINRRRSSNRLPTLEFGNSGIPVRVVQKLLVSSGYSIEIDGFFGALTEAAVKAFQNQRNLVVDGIVGQNTWRELAR
jgi:peptidoglycan hydrolase-like protein with peptidoglycan-binding domain